MPRVRGNFAARWQRKAGQAQVDYTEGVANPRRDWADSTKAAKTAYTTGLQAAIARGAWEKGVSNSGTEKWQARASKLGGSRFTQGVAETVDAYDEGVSPYIAVIERTALPARGPKGDPGNIQRVAVIAKALRDEKLRQQGVQTGGGK